MLAMIYIQPTHDERMRIRYTIAKLQTLKHVLLKLISIMDEMVNGVYERDLKSSLLCFVLAINQCRQHVQTSIDAMEHLFPLNHLNSEKTIEEETLKFNSAFECANHYEKKIIKSFRDILNDYHVLPEIRSQMQAQLNEIFYGFLKLKLVGSFSFRKTARFKHLF